MGRLLCVALFGASALWLSIGCRGNKPEESARAIGSPNLVVGRDASGSRAAGEGATAGGEGAEWARESWRLAGAGAAFALIVEREKPRVIGVGEAHKLLRSKPVMSALGRFTEEVLPVLANAGASSLVLETWAEREQCGAAETAVNSAVRDETERPAETETELSRLLEKATMLGMGRLGMTMSCQEYGLLLADGGGVDYGRLLTLITDKLRARAVELHRTQPAEKRLVIYGGALHNDVYPAAGLESWSYAPALLRATKGLYVEVDFYVPELIEDDRVLPGEWWFKLIDDPHLDQGVILVKRGPGSYVVLGRRDRGDPASREQRLQ